MAGIEVRNLRCSDVLRDLMKGYVACSSRGLLQSAKWLSELHCSVTDWAAANEPLTNNAPDLIMNPFAPELDLGPDLAIYIKAKSFFDLNEFDRCAYFTDKCTSSKGRFLHFYSRFMSGEKKHVEQMQESSAVQDTSKAVHLRFLQTELAKVKEESGLDGFNMYLYGVVLRKLGLPQALETLAESIRMEPLHWGAWLELAKLVPNKEVLETLDLPSHWIHNFFLAFYNTELQLNEAALSIYDELRDSCFQPSTYIKAQMAVAFNNLTDADQARTLFATVREEDPMRLDDMDIYSNILYVKELRVDLAHLAHHFTEVDPYRAETCCIIGNYYSLRGQHEKALVYFQRALKLCPSNYLVWTLMGHEYLELKNTNAAIQSYRQAIEINQRDYRAWYGLGQTYEILKMPFYCVYYYRNAQTLRPFDSRMLLALGDAYDKLDRPHDAKKCYMKAHSVGDVEGIALLRLARLYDRLKETGLAAAAYMDFLHETADSQIEEGIDHAQAYLYLASFYLQKGPMLDEAFNFAQKCVNFKETRDEAKALLREILQLRSRQDKPAQTDDDSVNQCNFLLPEHVTPEPDAMNLTFSP